MEMVFNTPIIENNYENNSVQKYVKSINFGDRD